MRDYPQQTVVSVNSISLSTLLELIEYEDVVDIVDMDIQGFEYKVLRDHMDLVNAKVKKIHIGTHSREIEEKLRILFNGFKWKNKWDYECDSHNKTPFGEIYFQDGVQTWINPNL